MKNEKVFKKIEDPLKEKNVLPLFAQKLSINHFSASQFSKPDGAWLIEHCFLTQPQRRDLLLKNAQMMAGVRIGDAIQKCIADTIWKLNSAKKIAPAKNDKLTRDVALQEQLEKFKEYEPRDEKDQTKHIRYIEDFPLVVQAGFQALEEIGGVELNPPVICEEQISITDKHTDGFFSCFLPVVGRTDIIFGDTSVPGKSLPCVNPDSMHMLSFPEAIIELKTVHTKLGKVKKNGERSFIKANPPTTPSFNHQVQCATYAAYYFFKIPVYLIYATANGYKIFTSNNCPGLTVEGLKRNFQIMLNVFRRREKLLTANEHKTREEIIDGAIELIDPMFDHPWCWNNFPLDLLKEVKEMWRMS